MVDRTYHIQYTDQSKGTLDIATNSFDDTLPIRLYGYNTKYYGSGSQQNMLHLLENFCSPNEPTKTEGMLWYKSNQQKLFLCTKNVADNLDWLDLTPNNISGAIVEGITPDGSLAQRTMIKPLVLPQNHDVSGDDNFAATKDFVRTLVNNITPANVPFGTTTSNSIAALSNDIKRILDIVQPVGTIITSKILIADPSDWNSYWKLCDEDNDLDLSGKTMVGYSKSDKNFLPGNFIGRGSSTIVEHSHVYRDTYASDTLDSLYKYRSADQSALQYTNNQWDKIDNKWNPVGKTNTLSKTKDKLKISIGPNTSNIYGNGLGASITGNNAYVYKEDTTGGITSTISQYDDITLLNDDNCHNIGNNYPPPNVSTDRYDIKLNPEQIISGDNTHGNYQPSYAVYMYVKYKSYV